MKQIFINWYVPYTILAGASERECKFQIIITKTLKMVT